MFDENKTSLTTYLRRHRQQKETTLKYDFMPSLLEIIERPAHPAGRWIVISISFLFLFLLLWASFSKVDVVVMGNGDMTPDGHIKVLTPITSGVVKSIDVKEGETIEKGATIATLDDSVANETVQQLETSLLEINSSIAVIQTYQSNKQATINISDYPIDIQAVIQNLIVENNLYRQQLSQTDSNLLTAQYEANLAQHLTTLIENKRKVEIDLVQQRNIVENLKIIAPTKGIVNNLTINHTGQTVGAENTIGTLLPVDSELIFEAQISDKDRADIKKGMKSVIKLQAYPYSDYGTISAKVIYISPDAFEVKGKGKVYIVRAVIDKQHLHKGINLISGLSGTLEIKTGDRSILDYFLDSIRSKVHGSLKEK